MTKPYLSIIIPCYNVEKYIGFCISSIISSDLNVSDYEIICVDDCSTDGTLQVLYNLQKSHNNLCVLHHETNKRAGGARNTGLKAAQGDYIWFVDADDQVAKSGPCNALKLAIDKRLDVLCFNYKRIDGAGNDIKNYIFYQDTPVQNGSSFISSVFGKNIVYYLGYIVLYLYRTDYLLGNKLYFPEGVCWEDTVYMPKSLYLANRIASIPDVLYAYRTNPISDTSRFFSSYPAQLIIDWIYPTGNDLLFFSKCIKEDYLRTAIQQTAITKYINGFTVPLFRTNSRERVLFFKLIHKNRIDYTSIKPYLTIFSSLLLSNHLGLFLASIGSMAYKLTHNNRRVK